MQETTTKIKIRKKGEKPENRLKDYIRHGKCKYAICTQTVVFLIISYAEYRKILVIIVIVTSHPSPTVS